MEKLRYWNFGGGVFELDEARVKGLDLADRAARRLFRLKARPADRLEPGRPDDSPSRKGSGPRREEGAVR